MKRLLLLVLICTSTTESAQDHKKYTNDQLRALRPPIGQNDHKFNPYKKKNKSLDIIVTTPPSTPRAASPVEGVCMAEHEKKIQ